MDIPCVLLDNPSTYFYRFCIFFQTTRFSCTSAIPNPFLGNIHALCYIGFIYCKNMRGTCGLYFHGACNRTLRFISALRLDQYTSSRPVREICNYPVVVGHTIHLRQIFTFCVTDFSSIHSFYSAGVFIMDVENRLPGSILLDFIGKLSFLYSVLKTRINSMASFTYFSDCNSSSFNNLI